MPMREGSLLLLLALVLPAAVLGFSAFSPAAAPALRPGSRAATLGLRRPAAWCAPVPHRTRLLCKEEGKPEEGEAAEAAPAEEAAAEAEVVEPEEPVDPFAGLDLDSKEFLQRKVEVLEKELEEATARVAELEGDAAAADPLIARGIVSSTKTQELVDTYFRLAADFDNFRKRAEGNLVQAKDTATADIVKELLTILDNFERAAAAVKTETDREKSINDSYQSVGKDLLKALTKLGVEPIESLGQPFDPNFHNAIQQAESTEYPEGVVSQGLQRGYKIGNRVVRPAMCVVSSGPGPEGGATPADGASPTEEASA